MCDACSSKRLQLVVIPPETDEDVGGLQAEMAAEFQLGHRASFMSTHSKASGRNSMYGSTSNSIRSSAGVGAVVSPGQSKKERTCDSCFTKLISAALDDASNNGETKDRHAIKQMKEVTVDLIRDLKYLLRGLSGGVRRAAQAWEEVTMMT